MDRCPSSTAQSSTTRLSFDSLPLELILDILPRIPDLATLCNLLHASPSALRAFNENAPASIVETVLSSGHTCRQIQFIFRVCALFKNRRLPAWNHIEVGEKLFKEPMQAEYRLSTPRDAYEPEPLAQDTKLGVIHVLLRIARDITSISLAYLADSLRLFRSLEPQHPVDDDFKFCSIEMEPNSLTRETDAPREKPQKPPQEAWRCQPETKKVKVTDVGSPTWTEEQRVMRAFWRLQLANETDMGAFTRPIPDYVHRLTWWHNFLVAIHRPIYPSQPLNNNEAKCYDYFEPALYSATMHRTPETPLTTPSPEYQEIVSAVDYIGERFGQESADELVCNDTTISELLEAEFPAPIGVDTNSGTDRKSRDTSPRWPMPTPTGNDEETILHPSAAVRRTFKPDSSGEVNGYSVLGCFGLASFSRYGFAFWCDERMHGYGLAAPKEDDDSSLRARIDWAWLSLLTPEELASVKEKHMRSTEAS